MGASGIIAVQHSAVPMRHVLDYCIARCGGCSFTVRLKGVVVISLSTKNEQRHASSRSTTNARQSMKTTFKLVGTLRATNTAIGWSCLVAHGKGALSTPRSALQWSKWGKRRAISRTVAARNESWRSESCLCLCVVKAFDIGS